MRQLRQKKYLQDGCICHCRKFYRKCIRKSHLEYIQIFWNMQRPTDGFSSHNRQVHLITYRRDGGSLRKLRQTVYRSLIAWVFGYLGRRNRKPIPSFVVQKVRSSYPDPKGHYRGYLQPFDLNAFDMAMD
ncbi:hypothetical protein XELAEV_18033394mg [Xenopus laevis]|uniref:P2X purinoreceptor 7 intracellular domain-containing protein n=1 Tax=Xenopus laevis TaxID=8355 RepID=A0A974HDY5_XENLA|nr:hypothetical protein XELAEV_18033394mg [Xenopus laevis]